MTSSDRERLRATFDADPELYDRARPLYPPVLFDDLGGLAALGNHAAVLEIGCGTGQATRPLAERGYKVFCVELGHNLAKVARTRLAPFPLVEVVTSPFETWDPAGRKFDLAFAATSWHWLDPTTRFEKAADVLKPNGALAIVTTHHVLPEQDGDRFFAEIQDSYVAIGEPPEPPPPPDEVQDQAGEIAASKLFGSVQVRRYLACHTYTSSDYISLLNTYSGHLTMKPSDRSWLYSEIESRIGRKPNGQVRKHYLFILHVAHPST